MKEKPMKLVPSPFHGLILTALLICPAILAAANSANPISVAEGDQGKPAAANRSSGSGAIFAWEDNRSGNSDIYAQLLCGCDTASWQKDGLPVCKANGEQRNPVIIGDTSDGAIIVWEDGRNGAVNIYAQRVDRHGAMLWAENGVALSASESDQKHPAIVADSSGGAIIVWEDGRNGADSSDIYAQRISQNGDLLWGAEGSAVCRRPGNQQQPKLICNLKGGALVAWQDHRASDLDIYSQALDSSGISKWDSNGVAISIASSGQAGPRLVSDGSGGGILVWTDSRSTTDPDIFAQRIDADGQVKWAPDGLIMNGKMSGDQENPVIDMDGKGGAILVWTDKRRGNSDLYGQRVDAAGDVQWAATGVPVSAAPGDQTDPQIVKLYRGGASVGWVDSRAGASGIYAQAINAQGDPMFGDSGMVLSAADSDQVNPVMVSDGDEGFIAVWQDSRSADFDIYSRIVPVQALGVRPKAISNASRSRRGLLGISPSGEIRYEVERAGKVTLEILDLSGHRLVTLVNGVRDPGKYTATFTATYSATTAGVRGGGGLRSGLYLCRFATDDFQSTHKISILL